MAGWTRKAVSPISCNRESMLKCTCLAIESQEWDHTVRLSKSCVNLKQIVDVEDFLMWSRSTGGSDHKFLQRLSPHSLQCYILVPWHFIAPKQNWESQQYHRYFKTLKFY